MTEKSQTKAVHAFVGRAAQRKGDGAFAFAAMMRAGAYRPDDAEMCAAKFEALGNEIERLRAEGTRRMNWILGLIDHAKTLGTHYATDWHVKPPTDEFNSSSPT